DRYRQNKWVLGTGEHDICRGDTEQAATMLRLKRVRHSLHVWGDGSKHDWPEWGMMARTNIPWGRIDGVAMRFGIVESFPPAFVARVNAMGVPGVEAELLSTGAVRMDEPARYRVIVDRISHDIPFYRSFLKNAVLTGTKVINNPFWWSADDKFFNYALASKLGVAVPPTVLLPHKKHPPGTTDRSMRNLVYPLDWDTIFRYVGFPAFLKPHDGGGWKSVYKVDSPEELFAAYDESEDLCMTLQGAVKFQEYFRCYVIDQKKVHVMRYDPGQPHHLRYVPGNPPP